MKIKAHIDCLKSEFAEHLQESIMEHIPYTYEDDVYEFEITISNVKNITEEVGVDEEGCRAFCDVEVNK